MKLKLIPRFYYSFRVIDVINAVISNHNNKRKYFQYFNTKNIYFFNSARAGLSVLLKSLSKEGSLKVGVQPYNCETVFQAIEKAGCTPVFIDINSKFSIDLEDLERKRNNVDVIIATHTFGIPADIDNIKSIMFDKIVIEDCAHAFFSEIKGKPCGTFGDASFFSMGYGKFPSIGHGGFVLINNGIALDNFNNEYNKLNEPSYSDEIFNLFKNLAYSIAFKSMLYRLITFPYLKKIDKKYDFLGKFIFYEKKGYRVNKNLLFSNYDLYLKINKERRSKSFILKSHIRQSQNLNNILGNNYYLFPILCEERNYLFEELLEAGYECGKHFSESISVAKKYGYIENSCPNAENIARLILTLPNHPYLREKDIMKIARIVNKYKLYEQKLFIST